MPSGTMAASDFVPQPGRPDLTICQLCIIDGQGPSGRARFAGRKGRAASAGSWSPNAKGGPPRVTQALTGDFGTTRSGESNFGHFERMKPSSTDNRANKSPGSKGCSVSRYSASPSRSAQKLKPSCPAGSSHRVPCPYARTASRLWCHPRSGQQRNRQRPAPRRGRCLALHK